MSRLNMYIITDAVNGNIVTKIQAGNGKAALRRFLQQFTATGIYEIHKCAGVWVLSSSYGSYFTAKKETE